ncbi:DUF3306 domain-containing protein [Hydrogenophaga sp.]|uniref:DUF3306 domain-containing protein n=1 Tax=Hydrogenophaga sp. TaxID=1904254 RepID=UPI00356429A3
MAVEDEGFLGRWSRRKTLQRSTPVHDEPALPAPGAETLGDAAQPTPAVVPPVQSTPEPDTPEGVAQKPPLPTLQDVQQLTRDSDFKPFVGRHVPADVRNAALKKLFTDPHYNVMDGLDIYIDDYSIPSPLPSALLAKMVSAQFMKLVDDPAEAQVPAAKGGPAVDDRTVAAAETPAENTPDPEENNSVHDTPEPRDLQDDHADLQLQPDHAPGPAGTGSGTR